MSEYVQYIPFITFVAGIVFGYHLKKQQINADSFVGGWNARADLNEQIERAQCEKLERIARL